uniref:Putative venom gland protein n=1 Tax=Megacormus gertschi TaxID=1843536 RepID=A0A224XBI2_9SCOR
MYRLAILSAFVVSVYSFSCPCWNWQEEDKVKYCPPAPTDCPLGITTDMCGCCSECYKVEGELCGGMWGMLGKCGEGLTCEEIQQSNPGDFYDVYMDGVCKSI